MLFHIWSIYITPTIFSAIGGRLSQFYSLILNTQFDIVLLIDFKNIFYHYIVNVATTHDICRSYGYFHALRGGNETYNFG